MLDYDVSHNMINDHGHPQMLNSPCDRTLASYKIIDRVEKLN